ncbi:hypothetical protein [Haliangium sp.]|uniref:hypothetical protein n=1 Tax=Haliangium sp. TaxID=2663208 RepID=UPI003D0CFB09
MSAFFAGATGCIAVVSVLVLALPRFQHWFVIPVTLCGILVAADAVAWLRGRVDVFDPIGILGLLGVHFFFVAPLLHVYWDRWISTTYWLAVVPPPADWRPWLGWMAWLNAGGLAVYRCTRRLTAGRSRPAGRTSALAPTKVWRLAPQRFWLVLGLAIGVTGLAQALVYASFGGIAGYVSAYEQDARSSFAGMGWVFLISESTPILLIFGVAAHVAARRRPPSWLTIALIILAFFVLRLLFGGLRGSRSNTIWALFWGVGVIHLWVRPIPKRVILAGLALLLTFAYLYGFYKSVGRDALRALEGSEERAALSEETGRSVELMLLGDLGRSDVQAFILYRHYDADIGVTRARGRTYLGALTLLVPRSLWPNRPATKLKEGTELYYGPGSYVPNRFHISYVYGLAGEAMLNFGAPAVPIAFALLGLLAGAVRRRLRAYDSRDSRQLMVPLLVNLCVIALVSDSDNLVFTLVKNGAVPFAVLWLGSRHLIRRPRSSSSACPGATVPATSRPATPPTQPACVSDLQ